MFKSSRRLVAHLHEVAAHLFGSPTSWRSSDRPHKLSRMADRPTTKSYFQAFSGHWFTAMSGTAGVVAGIVAALVTSLSGKIVLAASAAACFWIAAYRV